MAYRQGPYQLFVELPVPPRPEIHSSRNIDPAENRYTFDATTGGFEPMHSQTQRVLLLCSFVDHGASFVTPQEFERLRREILVALEPMTAQPSPTIEVKDIWVAESAAGNARIFVKFKDLTTGQDQTVQV